MTSKRRIDSDAIAGALFAISALGVSFVFGLAVMEYRIFPYSVVREMQHAVETLVGSANDGHVDNTRIPMPRVAKNPTMLPGAYQGVNLLTYISADQRPTVKLMDMAGATLHVWDADWFRVWPDATHVPEADVPKALPGTHLHGIVLLRDGSVVYNYTKLGLVRLDVCGNVVWRLPYPTHHSVILHQGELWVPGHLYHTKPDSDYPNHKPTFYEEMLLRISLEGKILQELSLMDVVRDNGYMGLLHMGTTSSLSTEVTGDFWHNNDIEPFPSAMTPGFFGPGDVILSLRNANTILVLNMDSLRIKYAISGVVTRQHDPDFVDGNTISVLDNNNIAPPNHGQNSRIITVRAPSSDLSVVYQGSPKKRFYSDVMGKHQWLPNGNLLIAEARSGRAFELDANRQIVWEYYNAIDEGTATLTEEVTRMPLEYGKYVADAKARLCP